MNYLFLIPCRTHQLRVHMAEVKHAILGDSLYGPREVMSIASRLCLHAYRLEFTNMVDGSLVKLEAPYDEAFGF